MEGCNRFERGSHKDYPSLLFSQVVSEKFFKLNFVKIWLNSTKIYQNYKFYGKMFFLLNTTKFDCKQFTRYTAFT